MTFNSALNVVKPTAGWSSLYKMKQQVHLYTFSKVAEQKCHGTVKDDLVHGIKDNNFGTLKFGDWL